MTKREFDDFNSNLGIANYWLFVQLNSNQVITRNLKKNANDVIKRLKKTANMHGAIDKAFLSKFPINIRVILI